MSAFIGQLIMFTKGRVYIANDGIEGHLQC